MELVRDMVTLGSVVTAVKTLDGSFIIPLLISHVITTPEVSSGIVAVCMAPELAGYTSLSPEYSTEKLALSRETGGAGGQRGGAVCVVYSYL